MSEPTPTEAEVEEVVTTSEKYEAPESESTEPSSTTEAAVVTVAVKTEPIIKEIESTKAKKQSYQYTSASSHSRYYSARNGNRQSTAKNNY